jgi:4-amino-4-deoxy-L-arabinose transferase-like glycosyltransferase
VLLAAALAVYLSVVLYRIADFPIYFFCDEAIHANLAESLVDNGFRAADGTLLPTYFRNDLRWNLSVSVYVHAVSVTLFGKSVIVTRATSAVMTVTAAIAVVLLLKRIVRARLWWAAPLVLAATPVWFLHARTAFETVMMASFYACFLTAYLYYRYISPRYLYLALIFAALSFYSYASGQGLVPLTALLLLLSDLRFHVQQLRERPRLMLGAFIVLLVLVLPYLRFRQQHPDALSDNLLYAGSYWADPIPTSEKLDIFWRTYLEGLSPRYWFTPGQGEIIRHEIKDRGYVPLLLLPFCAIGIGVCLWRWRSSAHRTLLIALLATPFAAAAGGLGATRVLAAVIPLTIVACLGLEQVRQWLPDRRFRPAFAIVTAAVLILMAANLLRTSLHDGPIWYSDYGLNGLQYGAAPVFAAIHEELARSPETEIVISPTWANLPTQFAKFFLSEREQARVRFDSIRKYLDNRQDLATSTLLVLPVYEYAEALASNKLTLQPPERVIPYPNGEPGFYFVRMSYTAEADAIFAAERAERAKPVDDTVMLDGEQIAVRHSRIDAGSLPDLFDGADHSLIRGLEANPFVLELTFPQPRTLSELALTVATMDFRLAVSITTSAGTTLEPATETYVELPEDPTVSMTLPGGPYLVRSLHIEITQLNPPPIVHIHVRELRLS